MSQKRNDLTGGHDHDVLTSGHGQDVTEHPFPVVQVSGQDPWFELKEVAREVIDNIADGKGDALFTLSGAQYSDFNGLLDANLAMGAAEKERLRTMLVDAMQQRMSYRQATKLLSDLMASAGTGDTDQAVIIRALQRPVLSRVLMKKIGKVFEDSEDRDEDPPWRENGVWDNRLEALETGSIVRTDPVFEAFCNALQDAVNSAEGLSPDEIAQRNDINSMITAAKYESHYYRDHHNYRETNSSVRQLLWESAQIMAGEPPAAADNLKHRHALLKALLPTQAEFNILWKDKNYPMAQLMAWHHSVNLPDEVMGGIRVGILKSMAKEALLSKPPGSTYASFAKDKDWHYSVLYSVGGQLSPYMHEPEGNELSGYLEVVYPAFYWFSRGERLGVLVSKVLTTAYEDRDKNATSALEYLLGKLLPEVNDPQLDDFRNKDVAGQENLITYFHDDIMGGTDSGKAKAIFNFFNSREAVAAVTGHFIRNVMADHERDAASLLQETSEPDYQAEFSVLQEHLARLCDRRSVVLVEQIAQHLIDSEEGMLVEEGLTKSFISYLRDDLSRLARLQESTGSQESGGSKEEDDESEDADEEESEKIVLDQLLVKLEASGKNLFTYRELADVVTRAMEGRELSETSHSSVAKTEQLRLWGAVLKNLLPVQGGLGWNRDWHKLYTVLNATFSKKIIDPLREVLQNFAENPSSLQSQAGNAQQDVFFLALLEKLDPVLKELEKEQGKLTQGEKYQVDAMRDIFNEAVIECSAGGKRYSPDSLNQELASLVHGQSLDDQDESARSALLEHLVPVTWGMHEGRLKQNGGFWGRLADIPLLTDRALSQQTSMGKQQPVDAPDAHRDRREVTLLVDTMASEVSEQADAMQPESHVSPYSSGVELLSPVLVRS